MSILQSGIGQPRAVDLGLSVKWASCNLGANTPEEYGDYFAWGETEPYYEDGYAQSDSPVWKSGMLSGYHWPSYLFEIGYDGSGTFLFRGPFSKYVTENSDNIGYVDNNAELDPEDDAAAVNWGGTWRMPTDADWTELRTKCTWTWTKQNGVNGYRVTGPNNNSIFLPAAGCRSLTDLRDAGSDGYYWSSSLFADYPSDAYGVYFGSDDCGWYCDNRCYGFSVRPVSE